MTDQDTQSPNKRRKVRAAKPPNSNVIRVAFGAGGGRLERTRGQKGGRADGDGTEPRADLDVQGRVDLRGGWSRSSDLHTSDRPIEPVTDVFSAREVAKLLSMTETRLRTLDRAQVVSPSGTRQGRRAYTFQDLIALRATMLLGKNVKLAEVARAIGALRQTLPKVTRPLQELRIVSDGRRVVVRTHDGAFEPVTGQMVLDFQVRGLRDDVVRILRPQSSQARARTAFDLYAKASALDEDPATYDEAEALYRRAVELDPQLAIAYTNLGNIRFRRGDDRGAEELYMKALGIDTSQPEAHYNLGYVMLERGEAALAVQYFETAIQRDARFGDAHFNLAMALEQLGERSRARTHWRRYLELEPQGTWAEIARQHL
jgi:DNA-binding transcriptional MerR regulator